MSLEQEHIEELNQEPKDAHPTAPVRHPFVKTALIASICGAVMALVGVLALLPVITPSRLPLQIPSQTQMILDDFVQRVSVLEKHPRLTEPHLSPKIQSLNERMTKLDAQIIDVLNQLKNQNAPSTQLSHTTSQTASQDETPRVRSVIYALLLASLSQKIENHQSIAEPLQLILSHAKLSLNAPLIVDLQRYESTHMQASDALNTVYDALKGEDKTTNVPNEKSTSSSLWGGLITITPQKTLEKSLASSQIPPASVQSLIDALKTHHLNTVWRTWQMLPDATRDTLNQNAQTKAMIMHFENRIALIKALDQLQREALQAALTTGQ